MSHRVIARTLALFCFAVVALTWTHAQAQTIAQAELSLRKLQQQKQNLAGQLLNLQQQQSAAVASQNEADQELAQKQADLSEVLQHKRNAEIKLHTKPTAENERLVQDLKRSLELSEKIVSRRELEVSRAERRYQSITQRLVGIQRQLAATEISIDGQRTQLASLKQQATAQAQAAAAEAAKRKQQLALKAAEKAEKAAEAKRAVAQPAEPKPAPAEVAEAPEIGRDAAESEAEEPGAAPSLDEQMDAINRASDSIFTTGW
ncbi:hypothetical protein [Halioxenophilus aromaticivorans]|uniref:Peptidase M23 n=1 Tax=Halioxenophilus aromaticivorans TaxID=1306992 RepID=A0AAV3U5C5_9ALTE